MPKPEPSAPTALRHQNPDPLAYTIEGAREATGLARSRLFLLIQSREIEARKAGRRTLIVGESLRAYMAKLPPARPAG